MSVISRFDCIGVNIKSLWKGSKDERDAVHPLGKGDKVFYHVYDEHQRVFCAFVIKK